MKKSVVICLALMLVTCSFRADTQAGEGAENGYVFQLQLTTSYARHDPDGLWSDGDIDAIRSAGLIPKIYTARIRTPSGEWLLSQLAGLCNPQGMCDTVLAKVKPGAPPLVYANPQVPQGGRAQLSLNYKKLTTEEIDENGHPFKGSYDVEPLK
jgi:hypothetical protein